MFSLGHGRESQSIQAPACCKNSQKISSLSNSPHNPTTTPTFENLYHKFPNNQLSVQCTIMIRLSRIFTRPPHPFEKYPAGHTGQSSHCPELRYWHPFRYLPSGQSRAHGPHTPSSSPPHPTKNSPSWHLSGHKVQAPSGPMPHPLRYEPGAHESESHGRHWRSWCCALVPEHVRLSYACSPHSAQTSQCPSSDPRHPTRYEPSLQSPQSRHSPAENHEQPKRYWPCGHCPHAAHVPGLSPPQPSRKLP